MLPAEFGQSPPLAAQLLGARSAIVGSVGGLLAVPDEALTAKWPWRGEQGQADVRYGFYRIYERLEEAANAVARLDLPRSRSADILGQATAARWDLHGLLLPLEADLDRDPGGGEWTLRQTMGHVISAQVSYTIRTIYAVHRIRKDPSLPILASDQVYRRLQLDDAGTGTLDEVRRRLDEWVDVGTAWLVLVDDDLSLQAPTIWANFEVDVHFRLHRWSSHFREHTVQLEKTLAMLGRTPREVDRLVRLLLGAYGWLEGTCLGIALEGEAGQLLGACADEVSAYAGQIVTAAGSTPSP